MHARVSHIAFEVHSTECFQQQKNHGAQVRKRRNRWETRRKISSITILHVGPDPSQRMKRHWKIIMYTHTIYTQVFSVLSSEFKVAANEMKEQSIKWKAKNVHTHTHCAQVAWRQCVCWAFQDFSEQTGFSDCVSFVPLYKTHDREPSLSTSCATHMHRMRIHICAERSVAHVCARSRHSFQFDRREQATGEASSVEKSESVVAHQRHVYRSDEQEEEKKNTVEKIEALCSSRQIQWHELNYCAINDLAFSRIDFLANKQERRQVDDKVLLFEQVAIKAYVVCVCLYCLYLMAMNAIAKRE